MKDVFVFGASNGGLNYIKNQNKYNIIGIIDNDVKKHGEVYDGLKVYPPEHIKNIHYDFIVIASMYIKAITKQLTDELQVDPSKILYAPKKMMKIQSNPFEDAETLKLAKQVLFKTANFLEKNNYKYFINFGTLLGIVREGDLLSWDDDIDIAILDNFSNDELVINHVRVLFKELAINNNVQVISFMKYNSSKELLGIDVEVSSKIGLSFVLSLDLLKVNNEHAHLPIDILPAKFFVVQDEVYLGENVLKAPSPRKEYLTHVYGEWNVVRKNVTFEDNTTTYNEPEWIEIVSEIIE